MEQKTELGMNRTGIQMSPVDAKRMQEGVEEFQPQTQSSPPEAGARPDQEIRRQYFDPEGLGSIPVPGTMKGAVKAGADMITGTRPQVLLDKLGERLGFERNGVRLYEAMLVKCAASPNLLPDDAFEMLNRFRDEEAQHFSLLTEVITSLGADPTSQSPCADLAGVKGMGLVQAMNDPRTTALQALGVILDGELLDNAGWGMLIELARSAGHSDIASRFQAALEEENEHLEQVSLLVARLTLADAGIEGAANAPA